MPLKGRPTNLVATCPTGGRTCAKIRSSCGTSMVAGSARTHMRARPSSPAGSRLSAQHGTSSWRELGSRSRSPSGSRGTSASEPPSGVDASGRAPPAASESCSGDVVATLAVLGIGSLA